VVGADQAARPVREDEVDGDEIGGLQQFFLRHLGRANLGGALGGEILAPGDHLHAEGLGVSGNAAAELSQADDAQPLAFEHRAAAQSFMPAPAAHVALRAREIARRGEHQAEREFGGDRRGAARRGSANPDTRPDVNMRV
jgi:hypothetical protein